MRILIHTDDFPPTMLAGSYRMEVFADQLEKLGNKVTVLTGTKNKGSGQAWKPRANVVYAPTTTMRRKTPFIRMISNLSFAVTSVFCAMGAGKIDVVITTSPPPLISISGWLIAKMKRAKLVYDVRDIWPEVALEMGSFSEKSLYCRVFRWITDFMYRHADLITAVTPGKVRLLQKKVGTERQNKVCLISNGYDKRSDQGKLYPEVVEEYHLEERFTCVYIGNVGMAQGLESLLEVARRTKHRDVQFLIFGTGAQKEYLEQKAQEEGLTQVRFCGALPHEKVFSVLKSAKISYIPLKNSNMKDSVPTKMYEALGLGCPVLLAAEGDACDILAETGLGCSVSPEDTDAIVAKFDEMVDRYDEILQNRGRSMELIRNQHSRQSATVRLNEKIQELFSDREQKE